MCNLDSYFLANVEFSNLCEILKQNKANILQMKITIKFKIQMKFLLSKRANTGFSSGSAGTVIAGNPCSVPLPNSLSCSEDLSGLSRSGKVYEAFYPERPEVPIG